MDRTRAWIGVGALVLMVGVGLGACGMADVRPDAMVGREDPAMAERGRAVLMASAEAHGIEQWRAHRTMVIEGVDRWPSWWVQTFLGWWPGETQRLEMQVLLGRDRARVELLDGDWSGQVLGVEEGRGYKQQTASGPVVWDDDKLMSFYLPSLQYFASLPFRLLEADVVLYGGESVLNGRRYHRVLVTWEKAAAHSKHDQYLVWINAETMRLEKCLYTVRDAFDGATGTIHFGDFRRVDGVWVAFRQTVVLATPEDLPSPSEDDIFHELVIDRVDFDSDGVEKLFMDASGQGVKAAR